MVEIKLFPMISNVQDWASLINYRQFWCTNNAPETEAIGQKGGLLGVLKLQPQGAPKFWANKPIFEAIKPNRKFARSLTRIVQQT